MAPLSTWLKTSNFHWFGNRNFDLFWHENHFYFCFFVFSIANWWLILFFITINCYFNTKLMYNAQTLHSKWWTHQSFYFLFLTGKKVSYKQFFMIKNLLNLILKQSCFGSIYLMFFFQDGEKTTHSSWTYQTLQVVKILFHQMLKKL